METWKDYYYGINEFLLKIVNTQQENMLKAAKICAETTKKGGIIYAFGCWHSNAYCSGTVLSCSITSKLHGHL